MPRPRAESGQATVLFALAAVALLSVASLSLDAGRAYVKTQQLKSAADAAALAGGQLLPQDPAAAAATAIATAAQNGVPSQDVTVQIGQQDNEITVTASSGINYYFAALFGVPHGNLHATSAVEVGPISQVTGAVPLGVVWNNFQYGQTYRLKDGGGEGSDGNYGGLALGGNGADTYQSNLEDGYQTLLQVGQEIETEPGTMTGPTEQGLAARITAGDGYSWQTVPPNSPAVVDVPIISDPGNGRSDVTVLGFAAFFLTSADCSGDVQGVFLNAVTSGEIGSGQSYGLQAERLVQ
jgi:hypothetical protein